MFRSHQDTLVSAVMITTHSSVLMLLCHAQPRTQLQFSLIIPPHLAAYNLDITSCSDPPENSIQVAAIPERHSLQTNNELIFCSVLAIGPSKSTTYLRELKEISKSGLKST